MEKRRRRTKMNSCSSANRKSKISNRGQDITREDSSKVGNSQIDSRFANIESTNVTGLKPGYEYSDLDENGLIKPNTKIDEKKVMIGKYLLCHQQY